MEAANRTESANREPVRARTEPKAKTGEPCEPEPGVKTEPYPANRFINPS